MVTGILGVVEYPGSGSWAAYLLGGSSQGPRTRKWLGTPISEPSKGRLEGEQPYLRDLLIMVINHLRVLR